MQQTEMLESAKKLKFADPNDCFRIPMPIVDRGKTKLKKYTWAHFLILTIQGFIKFRQSRDYWGETSLKCIKNKNKKNNKKFLQDNLPKESLGKVVSICEAAIAASNGYR